MPRLVQFGKNWLLPSMVMLLLALSAVYSLLYLAHYLDVSFFVLSNRGMLEQNVSSNLVSKYMDIFLWGGSLLMVLTWLLYNVVRTKLYKRYRLIAISTLVSLVAVVCLVLSNLTSLAALIGVTGLILLLTTLFSIEFIGVDKFSLAKRLLLGMIMVNLVIELLCFGLYNVSLALNLSPQILTAGAKWNLVELSLLNLGYPLLPYFYLFFVAMGVTVFFIKVAVKVKSGTNKSAERILNAFKQGIDAIWKNQIEFNLNNQKLFLAVIGSVIVSCLFVLATLLPYANPTQMLVSVDAPQYYEMISNMRSSDLNGAISYAFANDRALFLFLGYFLSFIFGTIGFIQVASGFLIALFSVVTFLVLRFFVKTPVARLLGVMLVPFSFQALGLIYAGYYANMLALILVLLYFYLFLKIRESWSSVNVLSLLAISIFILFSHSWTWFIFAFTLIGFIILEWRSPERKHTFKLTVILAFGSISVGLLCDVVRRFLSPVSASSSVFSTVSSSVSLPNPSYVLSGMKDTVYFNLGGIFANPLLLLLLFIGFMVILRFKSEVSNLLIAWVFVACIPMLFASTGLVFDRSLFLLPSVVLSAIGLTFIIKFFASISRKEGSPFRLAAILVVLAFVFFILLNWATRYVFNINIW